MGKPPITTDDAFIREVDEEVRRDQLAKFWSRWGRWLLVGIGAFLLVLAGLLYWREERIRAAGKLGEDLTEAFGKINSGLAVAAEPTLERAANASQPGYRALGKLTQAAVASQAGKIDRAVTLYTEVAADDSLPQPFRDLATLRGLRLQFDKLPPSQLIARLKSYAAPGNPWFGSAGEMLAIAYMRDGKPQLAATLFASIAKDQTVPPTLRSRAGQMASMLGSNPFPLTPAAPAAPKAPAKVNP